MNAPIDENGYQQWQPPTQQTQPPPPQSGFRYFWNHPVVIAGVMGMLLLLVTAISIVAIKAVSNDDPPQNTANPGSNRDGSDQTGNTVGPAPTSGVTNTDPATPPAQSQSAGSAPPVSTTNAVFLSGKLDIRSYDYGVDLDTAKKNSLGNGEEYDLDPVETALNAVNKAQVGVGAAAGAPSPAGCQAAAVKWGASAHVSVLGDGTTICVKTSDDRLAAFTVVKLDKSNGGQIQGVEIEYVVWKKQGDL